MILLFVPKLIKVLSRNQAQAMALYPFVLVNRKDIDSHVIRHEKIHLRQQLEMLILPFYLWYLIEFLFRLAIYKNKRLAYLNISFEREAYQNHFDKAYLKKRKNYAFMGYLKR